MSRPVPEYAPRERGDTVPILTVQGVTVRAGETVRVGAMVFDVAEDAAPGDILYYIDGALRHWQRGTTTKRSHH